MIGIDRTLMAESEAREVKGHGERTVPESKRKNQLWESSVSEGARESRAFGESTGPKAISAGEGEIGP